MTKNTAVVQFLLNGKRVCVRQVEPTRSVLNYLRYDMQLTGTKEGCAEGDCGACTVVVAELVNGELEMRAVNACIQFVPTLQGKAVYTVEYLRRQTGELHPVQQAMVDCHGSQCGFCTPGFIMSLWSVYVEHVRHNSVATDRQLRTALSGNLCRCTGYKPILKAGREMFNLPAVEFDHQPVIDQLQPLQSEQVYEYNFDGSSFFAPKTLEQLAHLRETKPEATILAGCTDIGLWVNKQFRDLGDIIYVGDVHELKQLRTENDQLYIGAAVSLNDAFQAIAKHFPEITQQWERFASIPIRNAGTLGGNVANGSPIGDSMPWLITLGGQVKLTSHMDSRTLALEDLYIDYMKNAMGPLEFVEAVIVPINQPSLVFRTYKLSKRYDSDISAVCAAFAMKLDAHAIEDARIAFGGMAAIPKRAEKAEAALIGAAWNEDTVEKAMASLSEDFEPLTDMRATDKNRMQSAQNLLYRFYLETRSGQPLAEDQTSVFAVD